jgi:1,4-alpha-glucan branching enzyme
VHHATRYASWLVQRHRGAQGTQGEALDQVVRELLLLQSSDWPFILKTGTATRYAEARIRAHVHRLRHLGHLIERERESPELDDADRAWLDDVRKRDNFLAELHGAELRAPFIT